ncbi:sortase domain-bontaining protein [Streptomyces sp. NPDC059819]|uniref:sortase domain-containing protein n=1 Tax=Streptomyces sp. NPDC059819 TaxID=3346963 RepID=UPI00365B6E97
MFGFLPGGRRGACTAATTVFAAGALTLVASVLTGPQPPPAPPRSAYAAPADEHHPGQPRTTAMHRSQPSEIVIPTIGLRTRVDSVTRATDGSVALPADPDHAGWYTGSVTPGENGNAITVGHVDSHLGPAAFYGLGALRNGSRITVTRHDGSTAHFTVSGIEVWAKDAFPSERVYGPTTTPTLTLITCTGWDSTHQTYRSNLVITAQLTPPPEIRNGNLSRAPADGALRPG